jgi:hypothetical protein
MSRHPRRVISGEALKAVRRGGESAVEEKSMPRMLEREGAVRPAASNLRPVPGEVSSV